MNLGRERVITQPRHLEKCSGHGHGRPGSTAVTLAFYFPADRITNSDRPSVEHFREGAAAPSLAHRLLKTGRGLLHLLAWASLAANTQPAGTNVQDAAARVLQIDARDKKICATRLRSERRADLLHQLSPAFIREQRDLAATAAIGVADEAAPWLENGGEMGVHASTLRTLDENGDETGDDGH